MNNADLVWRLIELLLEKNEKHNNEKTNDSKKSNERKQNEAQIADEKVWTLPLQSMLSFWHKKEPDATTHLVLVTQ